MVEDLSLEYRARLAIVKEEAGKIKAAKFLRNQNRVEEQRQVARNMRYMEGKVKGGSITQVNIVDKDGTNTELIIKII